MNIAHFKLSLKLIENDRDWLEIKMQRKTNNKDVLPPLQKQ